MYGHMFCLLSRENMVYSQVFCLLRDDVVFGLVFCLLSKGGRVVRPGMSLTV